MFAYMILALMVALRWGSATLLHFSKSIQLPTLNYPRFHFQGLSDRSSRRPF